MIEKYIKRKSFAFMEANKDEQAKNQGILRVIRKIIVEQHK
jgi:hypothetical protein